jgi:endonuclease/exonuclease/phosphatase family metal-dependent hydrolase
MQRPAPKLRVLTYNIHKGFNAFGRQYTLGAIRDAIRQIGANIVCLQEVQGEHRGHGRRHAHYLEESHFEYLADSVWPHYSYGKNAIYAEGHHGNAILSQFPIVNTENLDISTNPLERRGLLCAVVELPPSYTGQYQKSVHVFNSHLDLFEKGRRQQIDKISQIISSRMPPSGAVILAGDFNDWREKAVRWVGAPDGLEECHTTLHGRPAKTFPSHFPVFRLDRIYYRGLRLKSVQVFSGAGWARLSDHAALLAEFELHAE